MGFNAACKLRISRQASVSTDIWKLDFLHFLIKASLPFHRTCLILVELPPRILLAPIILLLEWLPAHKILFGITAFALVDIIQTDFWLSCCKPEDHLYIVCCAWGSTYITKPQMVPFQNLEKCSSVCVCVLEQSACVCTYSVGPAEVALGVPSGGGGAGWWRARSPPQGPPRYPTSAPHDPPLPASASCQPPAPERCVPQSHLNLAPTCTSVQLDGWKN